MADTLEVRRWLLGFGAEVEVLAPPSLRAAIRQEAERLAAALAPARKPPARAGAGAPTSSGLAGDTRPSPAPADIIDRAPRPRPRSRKVASGR